MYIELLNYNFIHITKTAGSSIEKYYLKNNKKIGKFDKKLNKIKNLKFKGCNKWHIPLKYFNIKLYNYYNYFTIVRNPYNRCISEFYCNWTGYKEANPTKLDFNKFITNKINLMLKNKIVSFIPCYEYVTDNKNNLLKNIFIIKFEELDKYFPNLIKINVSNKKKFTIEDFDNNTIKLINNIYHKDFELFNYNKITL